MTIFDLFDDGGLVCVCDATMLHRWGVQFWPEGAARGGFRTRSGKVYYWQRRII